MRKGESILNEKETEHMEQCTPESPFTEEYTNSPADENASATTNHESSLSLNENSPPSNAETSSKFNLKFKELLKKKGRHMKRTKQLTFNKTPFNEKKGKGNQKKSYARSFAIDAWL